MNYPRHPGEVTLFPGWCYFFSRGKEFGGTLLGHLKGFGGWDLIDGTAEKMIYFSLGDLSKR